MIMFKAQKAYFPSLSLFNFLNWQSLVTAYPELVEGCKRVKSFKINLLFFLIISGAQDIFAGCCPVGSKLPTSITSSPLMPGEIVFSPDGACLAVARVTLGGQVDIYEMNGCVPINPTVPFKSITGIDGSGDVAFSSNGGCLAIADDQHSVFIYSMDNCTPSADPVATISITDPSSVSFSPQGCLAVSYFSVSEALVNFYSMSGCMPTLVGSTLSTGFSTTGILRFSPDGNCLAIGSFSNGIVKIYTIDNCQPTFLTDIATTFSVISALAFSPDGSCLAIGDNTGSVNFYQINGCTPGTKSPKIINEGGFISGLAFSPDGSCLAVSNNVNNTVNFYPISKCSDIFLAIFNKYC